MLKSILKERNTEDKKFHGTQLSGLCETRWVERHDSIIKFKAALPSIVEALDKISEWSDANSSSKANSLNKSGVILALINILEQTLSLSRILQTPKLDLKNASDLILDTLSALEDNRKNCDKTFSTICSGLKCICSDLDVDIKVPRVIGRQRNRANYSASTPEQYYKKSIYIPLLDNVINDIKARFPKDTLECFGL